MSEPNQNEPNGNEHQVFDDSIFNKPQEGLGEAVENVAAEASAQPPAPEQNWQANAQAQPMQDPTQPAYAQPAYQAPNPNAQYGYAAPAPGYAPAPGVSAPKSKVAAGVLGILLGSLGIHKFYLGYTVPGLIMLLVTVLTLGFAGIVMGIIGLVEGIIYLTMSDADFYRIYVAGKKEWF